MTTFASLPTPIGPVEFELRGDILCRLAFCDAGAAARRPTSTAERALARAIEDYFDGKVAALANVPVAAEGSPFHQDVWHMLRTIEPGRTASYGHLAKRLGRPGAARAVGRANHDNPIALVIPCHRVIGQRGQLTGYAGGLERKQWLLRHEGALLL